MDALTISAPRPRGTRTNAAGRSGLSSSRRFGRFVLGSSCPTVLVT